MKLITRDTDYAIRALCYMAKQPDRFASVSQLIKYLKIPRAFLRKILQILTQEEILISYKGKGGGFKLAKKPDKIFLVDLMRAFRGDFVLNECIFKKKICPNRTTCRLRKRIEAIQNYVISELSSITIAQLI